MNFKLTRFRNLTQGSLVYTLEVSSFVGNTKASSEYIVSRAHPYIKQICIFQHREII